jgi:outer membrane protein OmpA-like peptidoglycan-associated protein
MFRISTWVFTGIIAALLFVWVLQGASLEGPKGAGWTDLGTWGWGGLSKSAAVTVPAATAVGAKVASEKVTPPVVAPAPAPAPPKVENEPAEVAEAPQAKDTAAPADQVSKGVPHGFPWPIATEVPNWGAVLTVPAPAPSDETQGNAETTMEVAEAEPAQALPWPIATEVPDWSAVMKVPAPTQADDADGAVEAPQEASAEPSKGEPHPLEWPIATEVPKWEIQVAAPPAEPASPAEPAVAAETAPALEPAAGVPHPFPWPIASEVPKWDIQIAAPPAPAAEVARRAELTPEQVACEDELRRIYKSGVIRFKSESAVIDSKSSATLTELAQAAKGCAKVRIRIEGHTDARGSKAVNQSLSERRAQAIVAFLTGAGVDQAAVTAQGFGEERPVVANDTEANMALNRRIEFTVY